MDTPATINKLKENIKYHIDFILVIPTLILSVLNILNLVPPVRTISKSKLYKRLPRGFCLIYIV